MFQRPHPLKSNIERRNLRKKRIFSELEVDPHESGVEVDKDTLFGSMKTGVKGARKNTV